jgi:murein endopeptidase
VAAKDTPQELLKAPKAANPGDQVIYTIAHGGTLLNVANLYKIHHHEVIALNPGADPERPLPRGSEVVVYRNTGEDSESIGLPHDGHLVGAMPFPDGAGRRVTAERWKTWGTRNTVRQLDRVLDVWAKSERKGPPVLVSNLSARDGGPLSPHKTHQSGRDADLSYITQWDGQSRVEWQRVNEDNLDARRTWKLLQLLNEHARIEVIFIDRRLQRALLDYALKHGVMPRSELAHWLEVARGERRGGPLVKHVPGHQDHLHVRFACRDDEPRCKS